MSIPYYLLFTPTLRMTYYHSRYIIGSVSIVYSVQEH